MNLTLKCCVTQISASLAISKHLANSCRRSSVYLSDCHRKRKYSNGCPRLDNLGPLEPTRVTDALDGLSYDRLIPKVKSEADQIRKKKFTEPSEACFLRVAILGTPNAGKSTLTNMLVGWRVCSVSKKVHTTKHNTKAVLVEGNKQIVFVDTPGLVSLTEKRRRFCNACTSISTSHKLEWEMLTDPKSSLASTDLVVALVDASNQWTRHRIDMKILDLLKEHGEKRAILVLNKVDLVKNKKFLLDLTAKLTDGVVNGQKVQTIVRETSGLLSMKEIIERTQRLQKSKESSTDGIPDVQGKSEESTPEDQEKEKKEENEAAGWPGFQEVFMISALQGLGVDKLRQYLLDASTPGRWQHHPSFVTDQNPQEIATMAVREKLMDKLPKEMPYNIRLVVEMWDVNEHGVLNIVMQVNCLFKHHLKFVIGPQGRTVSEIAQSAKQELMNSFRCEVSLKLIVQYKET